MANAFSTREFWRTVQERYAEIRYEVPQIIAEGDAVAAYLRVFFRKRSNDRVVQFDYDPPPPTVDLSHSGRVDELDGVYADDDARRLLRRRGRRPLC